MEVVGYSGWLLLRLVWLMHVVKQAPDRSSLTSASCVEYSASTGRGRQIQQVRVGPMLIAAARIATPIIMSTTCL